MFLIKIGTILSAGENFQSAEHLLLKLCSSHLWPSLTFVQVADHSLLLQEVIAQLLAQTKRQHVVSERAGGKNTHELAPLLPPWGEGTGTQALLSWRPNM